MGSPTYWQELVLEYPGSQHMLDRSVPHRLKFRSGVEGRNTAKFGLLISIIILGYTMSKPTLFGIYMRGLRQPVPFLHRNQPYSVYILEVILNDGIPVSETNIPVRAATA